MYVSVVTLNTIKKILIKAQAFYMTQRNIKIVKVEKVKYSIK